MTEAPERILAFRWPHGGRAWRELDMDAPIYAVDYTRLDAHKAAVAAARHDGMLEAAKIAGDMSVLSLGRADGRWEYTGAVGTAIIAAAEASK